MNSAKAYTTQDQKHYESIGIQVGDILSLSEEKDIIINVDVGTSIR
jgi:hypothetical protein